MKLFGTQKIIIPIETAVENSRYDEIFFNLYSYNKIDFSKVLINQMCVTDYYHLYRIIIDTICLNNSLLCSVHALDSKHNSFRHSSVVHSCTLVIIGLRIFHFFQIQTDFELVELSGECGVHEGCNFFIERTTTTRRSTK